jgi:hypothetical protein
MKPSSDIDMYRTVLLMLGEERAIECVVGMLHRTVHYSAA